MWNIRKPLAPQRARGLTLVEMLMATALTLIMFAAVAQIFGMMGGAMQDARATIELSGNLRSVANHLQNDLNNLTVEVKPWVQPGSNQGYFEIIEGPDRDVDFAAVDVIPDTAELNGAMGGDADDIICFTAYSKDEPFVGQIQGELKPMPSGSPLPHKFWIDRTVSGFTTITSQYAEIVYFTKLTDADDRNLYTGNTAGLRDAHETVTLYRRVFLIRPDIYFGLGSATSEYPSHDVSYDLARNDYDLSMSSTTTDNWQTNSLEDLQLRQRRMARRTTSNLSGYPFPLLPNQLKSFEQLNSDLTAGGTNTRDRTGEDVVLTRVLAFDVRVFDPGAVVKTDSAGAIGVQPGDPGFDETTVLESLTTANMMTGAFVDLNWTAASRASFPTATGFPTPLFAGAGATASGLHDISINGGKILGTPGDLAALNAVFPQMPSRITPVGSTTPNLGLRYSYYDTWPFAYEITGVDRDRDGAIDNTTSPAINGFDDNGNGIVDELAEYETSPPYPVPLRGISITVRAIEEGSRQVRQDTIMADFLPK